MFRDRGWVIVTILSFSAFYKFTIKRTYFVMKVKTDLKVLDT